MQTELGRIAGLIQGIKKETTPLQRRLEEFGKILVYICFVLVALVFGLEILRGGKVLDMFLTSVSLAVAAIPEGLPGRRDHRPGPGRPAHGPPPRPHPQAALGRDPRLRHGHLLGQDRHADPERDDRPGRLDLARRLRGDGHGLRARGRVPAAAGRVDPRRAPRPPQGAARGRPLQQRRARGKDGKTAVFGDPTEIALLSAAAKAGIWKGEEADAYELVEEIPFDSERKKMTIVRRADQDLIAFIKGAPDLLLRRLRLHPGGRRGAPAHGRRPRPDRGGQRRLSDQALRVLAVAYRDFDQEPHSYAAEAIERDLTFAGLVAMIDPPRPEVRDAMAKCRRRASGRS